MIGLYRDMNICGMVAVSPETFVDNLKMTDFYDEKVVKRQVRVTGIHLRPVLAEGQRAADLCITAAKRLMERLEWKGDEVNYLVFVSSYSSYRFPATSYFIQNQLGIGNQCRSLDIQLACSGFVAGLQTIGALFQGGSGGEKAILLVSDTATESIKEGDPATGMLFGDCAAAVAIEKKEGAPLIFMQKSDGRGYEDIIRKDGRSDFRMNGMAVFNFAISDVVDTIQQYFGETGLLIKDIDYFLIHQAQKFIVDKIRDFCGFPVEKVPVSYDRYGNTGCASIPLTVCENKNLFRTKEKTKVFMCAFGAGHSWGCATTELDSSIYLETFQSNKIYADGREVHI